MNQIKMNTKIIPLLIIFFLFSNCNGGKLIQKKITKDTPLSNRAQGNGNYKLLKMGILKFKSISSYNNDSQILYLNMVSNIKKQKLFNIINQKFIKKLWYPYSKSKIIPTTDLDKYQKMCSQYKVDYLTMGRIYYENKMKKVEVKLYSKSDNKIIYSCTEIINNSLTVQDMAKFTVGRIFLSINGMLPEIKLLKIAKGKSYENVLLQWQNKGKANHYKILRSKRSYGPYVVVGKTGSPFYIDSNAEPGLKYWYKVFSVYREVPSTSLSSYGYKKPPNPKSLTVKEIINKRKRSWPSVSGDEKSKEKKWIGFWKKYYENYFTASLIYLIGRMYINSGKLQAYRDFDSYYLDYKTRILYLKKNKMTIKLYSGRLVRFLNKFEKKHKVNKEEVLARIINNCLAFCLRIGEIPKKGQDGLIRYVPYFESIGISTEYHRDYKNWRSNTIIFGTYDKKLKKKLYSAWRKGV